MTVSLVFNELSLRSPAPDLHTARTWMTEFVTALRAAVEHDVVVLRMRESFGNLLLSPNYPVHAWFHDKRVSREEQEFVLTYQTRYPYIRPYDEDLLEDQDFQSGKLLFEGRFEGKNAEGLGYAFLLHGLALSFVSESCWDTPWLSLECETIVSDSNEIETAQEVLHHVSRSQHVAEDHSVWIEERIRDGVRTGFDLLRVAEERYPRMLFCSGARKQIERLSESSTNLPRVRDRLFELGRITEGWERGDFNYRQIRNASDESQSTISEYGELRRFVCPDGERRLFSWHLKGLPFMWRIHICAHNEERNVLIGYVGKHLPTVRNPT